MTYFPTANGGNYQTLTDGATVNWDAAISPNAVVTLGGNRTIAAPTNATNGQVLGLIITQDDTGSRTVTWDALFKWNAATAPTLTTTAKYSDYLEFVYYNGYFIELRRTLNLKLYEDPPPPPSIINAIYPLEITLAGAAKTGTQTITAVNTANCIIIPDGAYCESPQWFQISGYPVLTNSTTVTFTRSSSNTPDSSITFRGTLIEFSSGVLTSVQNGVISSGSSTATATITSVDTSRSIAIYRGHIYPSSGSDTGGLVGIALTSATQVTRYGEGLGVSCDTAWTVAEFHADYVQSVQNIQTLLTSSGTGDSITVSSVDTANTLLFYNGMASNSGSDWNQTITRLALTGATTVTSTRGSGTANNRRMCFALLELVDGVINATTNSTITMSSTASGTATITAVDTAKTVVLYGGVSTSNTGVTNLFTGSKVNSPTQLIANRVTGSGTVITALQTAEFV